MLTKREAKQAGRRAGHDAATWLFNGAVTDDEMLRLAQMIEDGDPRMDEHLPRIPDLSGEWAGESMNEILGVEDGDDPDRIDEIASAWEDGVQSGYWKQIHKKIPRRVWKRVRRANPSRKGRELSVPEKHQLRIARDTLKMHDAAVGVMGGPTKEEAREIIFRLTGKRPKRDAQNPRRVRGVRRTVRNPVRDNPRVNVTKAFRAWLQGKVNRSSHSIWSSGDVINSYNTWIVERRRDGTVYFNKTKYSVTTSTQQNQLRVMLREAGIPFTEIESHEQPKTNPRRRVSVRAQHRIKRYRKPKKSFRRRRNPPRGRITGRSTIDITPSWVGVYRIYVQVAMEGTTVEGRKSAWSELERMAQLADKYVALQKKHGKNPPLAVFGNPKRRSGVLMSKNVHEIRYQHCEDGKNYKHPFRRNQVQLILTGNNKEVVMRRVDGKPIVGDFA